MTPVSQGHHFVEISGRQGSSVSLIENLVCWTNVLVIMTIATVDYIFCCPTYPLFYPYKYSAVTCIAREHTLWTALDSYIVEGEQSWKGSLSCLLLNLDELRGFCLFTVMKQLALLFKKDYRHPEVTLSFLNIMIWLTWNVYWKSKRLKIKRYSSFEETKCTFKWGKIFEWLHCSLFLI